MYMRNKVIKDWGRKSVEIAFENLEKKGVKKITTVDIMIEADVSYTTALQYLRLYCIKKGYVYRKGECILEKAETEIEYTSG
jgi:predicted transcriptional regulator